jgi:hypothetical protein
MHVRVLAWVDCESSSTGGAHQRDSQGCVPIILLGASIEERNDHGGGEDSLEDLIVSTEGVTLMKSIQL